eukprot:Hpha_TRINITY_DN12896_c0_g1::TRINITY_DN12896_c0_g1_i1::g.24130::m.24130
MADEQGDALKSVAAAHRRTLLSLYESEGGKSRTRTGLRKMQKLGTLGKSAKQAFDTVLSQEQYNRSHWRNTTQVMVFEQADASRWGFKEADQFIFRAAKGEECNTTAVERIQKQWPRLRQIPDAGRWLEQMMLPFRSAVCVEVAERIVREAHDLPADDKEEGTPEWRHLQQFCPSELDADIVDASDAFEESVMRGKRAAPAAARLRKWAAQGHTLAAYYYVAWSCASADGSMPPNVTSELLRECGEGGMVPALVAHGSVLLHGVGGVKVDRKEALLQLELSLQKGDSLQFPLAAYLLAQAHDGVHGGRRNPRAALRWYQECSDLVDSAREDGRGFFPGGGRVFPFWPVRKGKPTLPEQPGRDVDEAVAGIAKRIKSLEGEVQRLRENERWWKENVYNRIAILRRSPMLKLQFVLVVLIAVAAFALLALPAADTDTGPNPHSAPHLDEA